jgi:hypothetical protein
MSSYSNHYRYHYTELSNILVDESNVEYTFIPHKMLLGTKMIDVGMIMMMTHINNIKEYAHDIRLRELLSIISEGGYVYMLIHIPYKLIDGIIYPHENGDLYFPDELENRYSEASYIMRAIDVLDRIADYEHLFYVVHPRYYEAKLKLIWYLIYMGCDQFAISVNYNTANELGYVKHIYVIADPLDENISEYIPDVTRPESGWLSIAVHNDEPGEMIELIYEQLSKLPIEINRSSYEGETGLDLSLYEIDSLIKYLPTSDVIYEFSFDISTDLMESNLVTVKDSRINIYDIDMTIDVAVFVDRMVRYLRYE